VTNAVTCQGSTWTRFDPSKVNAAPTERKKSSLAAFTLVASPSTNDVEQPIAKCSAGNDNLQRGVARSDIVGLP